MVDNESFITGIKDIKVESVKNGKIYNLQGMEIAHPAKGQMYIKNGKKVIF